MRIPLDNLVLNPEVAARIRVDEEYLKVLMKSLKEDGQLHPITVRPLPDGKYEIIDGLHRVEAAKRLDWKDIEANVVSLDDLEAKFLALKANLVRRNLEPVQEGELVYRIMVKHGLTEKQVAEKLGVSVEWVSKRLALVLKVHEEVRRLVEARIGRELDIRRFKVFLENEERIDKVARYIAQHFRENVDCKFKAMVVAASRKACGLYKRALDLFEEHRKIEETVFRSMIGSEPS